MAARFLTLDGTVLRPPLSAIVALVMAVGIAHLGWRLTLVVKKGPTEIEVSAGIVTSAALIAGVVHSMALAQASTFLALRPIAAFLMVIGVLELVGHAPRRMRRLIARLRGFARTFGWTESCALLTAAVITVALALAAFGPPTDADSLDYHLGVPLDWLRHGGAYARHDWLHARLVGLGEALNMLGVAAGTDALGAALQLMGLVILVAIPISIGTDGTRMALGVLLVAACPIMVFLVPNQKPHVLPLAAVTVALVLLVMRDDDLDVGTMVLVFGALAFAGGCKYTFLLSGGVVLLVAFTKAWRADRFGKALLIAGVAAAVLVVPVYARNLVFYGDPVSPFLERFRSTPDPTVTAFAVYLREWGGAPTAGRMLRLPLELIATLNPGKATTVLGLGIVAFALALPANRMAKRLLAAAALSGAITIVGGQLAPRFFLEPYVWASMAVAVSTGSLRVLPFLNVMMAQGLLIAAMSVCAAAKLIPGAFTAAARTELMREAAYGYAEANWLNDVLPADAVILTSLRSRALIPRPFVVDERPWLGRAPSALLSLCSIRSTARVTAVVRNDSRDAGLDTAGHGHQLAGPALFHRATRNPWNSGVADGPVTVWSADGECP